MKNAKIIRNGKAFVNILIFLFAAGPLRIHRKITMPHIYTIHPLCERPCSTPPIIVYGLCFLIQIAAYLSVLCALRGEQIL